LTQERAATIWAKTVARGVFIAAVALSAAWLRSPAAPVSFEMGPTVETQGVIASIDPDTGSFTIAGPQGTQEFFVTSSTVIDVGRGEQIAFRDLAKFVGTGGIVRSADTGAYQYASRVTILAMPAQGTVPGAASAQPKP